jgi:hypothetical protein
MTVHARILMKADRSRLDWLWTNYRKGPRVVTLQTGWQKKKLEALNALARTCKALHQENKGLIFKVNVIRVSLSASHPSMNVPKRCHHETDGSDCYMRGFQEALQFFRQFVPREGRPNTEQVQLKYYGTIQRIEQNLGQFNGVMNDHRELQIAVKLVYWDITLLDDDARQEIVELEEEGEP